MAKGPLLQTRSYKVSIGRTDGRHPISLTAITERACHGTRPEVKGLVDGMQQSYVLEVEPDTSQVEPVRWHGDSWRHRAVCPAA